MVFERFVSEARDEPPDIDVDFEHERREEVIQYIYQPLRPRPRRHLRHRHPLPRQAGDPRGRRRHGPQPRHRRGALLARSGAGAAAACRASGWSSSASTRTTGGWRRPWSSSSEIIGFPRHLSPARRRLRHHRGPARRAGADRERGDGGPHRHLLGQGRHRRARHPQGRRAGARHAHLHPQGASTCSPSTTARATPSPPCRPRTRRSTTCSAGRTRSASSRWRAARR